MSGATQILLFQAPGRRVVALSSIFVVQDTIKQFVGDPRSLHNYNNISHVRIRFISLYILLPHRCTDDKMQKRP